MERDKITVYDREKRVLVDEKIESEALIRLLYERHPKALAPFRKAMCGNSLFSRVTGALARTKLSANRVEGFVEEHELNRDEFEKTEFSSFDDFFTRKLKQDARPLANESVVMPCDARYLAYENFAKAKEVIVKGQKFSLHQLLGEDDALTEKYLHGPFIIARLAPPDYHRFHFPVEGVPTDYKKIKGGYHSVNPFALRYKLKYLTENKRSYLQIKTPHLGDVLAIAVGATCVGSIHYTYTPNMAVKKGDEMGYFSFGGSTLILLFEPGKVELAADLIAHSQKGVETLAKMGTPLAKKI